MQQENKTYKISKFSFPKSISSIRTKIKIREKEKTLNKAIPYEKRDKNCKQKGHTEALHLRP